MAQSGVWREVCGYKFWFVPLKDANFRDAAAIYVVIDVFPDGQWVVLDVGESGQVGKRIDSHDRKECWLANSVQKNIWVGVCATPTTSVTVAKRLEIESLLRQRMSPRCGCR